MSSIFNRRDLLDYYAKKYKYIEPKLVLIL